VAATAAAGVLDGAAGGVVVVAELLLAEAWAAAAAAVGEDVAALVALDCVLHGVSPPVVLKVSKSSKQRACRRTSAQTWLNAKARLMPGSFFILSLL
jgi:hypothetical protein